MHIVTAKLGKVKMVPDEDWLTPTEGYPPPPPPAKMDASDRGRLQACRAQERSERARGSDFNYDGATPSVMFTEKPS